MAPSHGKLVSANGEGVVLRLKRKFVALIVVVMLVVTVLLASMLSQYAQGGRIAYVSVKTDKGSFTNGENISFNFVPMTTGIDFSTSGKIPYSYGTNLGAIHIIKIPDGQDPDRLLNDRSMLDTIWSWDRQDMAVAFDYFNSTDGTKSLSWNGTVMRYSYGDQGVPTLEYRKAMGGYYLIYPSFWTLSGHQVKFQLDRNAIFYLDTLNLRAVPSIEGSTVTYSATISAPLSLDGNSHCNMTWSVGGMNTPSGNVSNNREVDFDLAPGGRYDLTVNGSASPYPGYQSFFLSGWINTSWGNYTIEQYDYYINGRWSVDNQHPYL